MSEYSREPMPPSQADDFPADRVVGGLAIAFDVVGLAIGCGKIASGGFSADDRATIANA